MIATAYYYHHYRMTDDKISFSEATISHQTYRQTMNILFDLHLRLPNDAMRITILARECDLSNKYI